MPSRQDQLHSHQFMVQRVVSALVMRETDPEQSPFRRAAGASLVGVLLAALAVGGVAAYGLISPGGSGRWKDPDAVIVEKESGARFVYREGRLHPVANYTSALLVIGSPGARTVSVARRSLDGVPRGVPLGIDGAPDSLPPRRQLRRDAWTVCSRRTGPAATESVLFVAGAGGTGGRAVPEPADAPALLVATADGARFVIWRHHRHLVRDPEIVLPRLVWTAPPLPVAPAFVNALPAGADLAIPAVPGRRGASVARPAGGRVGQVYVVTGADGARNYFVAVPDGLASLTPLQKELLLADPQTATLAGRADATELGRAEFAALGPTVRPLPAATGEGALPSGVPRLVEVATGATAGTICVSVPGNGGTVEVRVEVPLPAPSGGAGQPGAVPTTRRTGDGGVLADAVVVSPGSGVLVAADPSVGSGSGVLSLVTDAGRRYAVPGDEVLAMLGYGGQQPVHLPAELVSLLPAGPALDPRVARGPAGG